MATSIAQQHKRFLDGYSDRLTTGGVLRGQLFKGTNYGTYYVQGELPQARQLSVSIYCFLLKLPFDNAIHFRTPGFIALGDPELGNK